MPLERDYVNSKNFCSNRWMLENKTELKNLDGHINHKIKKMEKSMMETTDVEYMG